MANSDRLEKTRPVSVLFRPITSDSQIAQKQPQLLDFRAVLLSLLLHHGHLLSVSADLAVGCRKAGGHDEEVEKEEQPENPEVGVVFVGTDGRVHYPFLPIWLSDVIGLNKTETGLVFSSLSLFAICFQPRSAETESRWP
jgi:hypothetical protein